VVVFSLLFLSLCKSGLTAPPTLVSLPWRNDEWEKKERNEIIIIIIIIILVEDSIAVGIVIYSFSLLFGFFSFWTISWDVEKCFLFYFLCFALFIFPFTDDTILSIPSPVHGIFFFFDMPVELLQPLSYFSIS
jgi:hypothetical protein